MTPPGGTAQGNAIAVDPLGNFVVTGSFLGSMDFGGGPLIALGNWAVFLAKYDSDGNHIWSRAIDGPELDLGNAVAVDALGNITITGSFEGTIDFGGGAITAVGQFDIFVAQYDSDGNHVWSRGIGGTSSDVGNGIVVDAFGNVTVTGLVGSVVNFGGGNRNFEGFRAGFVAQYDTTGKHVWSRVAVGGGSQGNAIAVDALGNVAVTGRFNETIDFGTGPIGAAGSFDFFVAQFDNIGNPIQLFGVGGVNSFEEGFGIAVDALGNIAVTGHFQGESDLGGGVIGHGGRWSIFVALYDAAGNHLWSRGMDAFDSLTRGRGIAVDAVGNVAITGSFKGTIDFGGGDLTSAGPSDIFVAQYDNTGAHIWSRRIGGPSFTDFGLGIATDAAGSIAVTGMIDAPADFGDGEEIGLPGNNMFIAQYTGDPFVASAAAASASSSGGGCFIASATYGTPMAGEIDALRAMRDAYLLDSAIGSAFVDTYYRMSPPIADAVSRSPVLQALVRVILTPIVILSKGVLATPGLILSLLILMLTVLATLYAFPRRSVGTRVLPHGIKPAAR